MGYRERRAHRQQQKQQSLGQGYSRDQRITIDAPEGMNYRDSPMRLPPSDCALLYDFVNEDGALVAGRELKTPIYLTSTSGGRPLGFITYDACGSNSTEFWAVVQQSTSANGNMHVEIYNAGQALAATATASAISAPGVSAAPAMDYEVFNNTVIMVTGANNCKWTRASGWTAWSATASADNINEMFGIKAFKSRLFAWKRNDNVFWYGSADQVEGTFNSFSLAGVMKNNLSFMTNITRDGGAGPDDYAAFVSQGGEVVVYQGTDPGDANAWSLVGTYSIGRPLSENSHIQYGQQTVVLCTDDFYFLPDDLVGRRRSTKAAKRRSPEANRANGFQHTPNAVYWPKKTALVFSDGSVLNTAKNFAYSQISVRSSVEPHELIYWSASASPGRPPLGVHQDRLFAMAIPQVLSGPSYSPDSQIAIWEYGAKNAGHKGKYVSQVLPTSGRTNISMFNPILGYRKTDVSAPATGIKFRTTIVYDKQYDWTYSASAETWVTTSVSADSYGLWLSGFGTGDNAQIHLQILSADSSGDVVFQGINVAVSDTGGI